jgi:putative ABC transport system permease protein
MKTILSDVRYGLRMLRKNLGLTVIIIFSIGLGIGANSTIFSLLALRPLPGSQNPAQLVEVYTSYQGGMRFGAVSYPDYRDWRDRNQGFSGIVAQDLVPVNLTHGDYPAIIPGSLVSGNFFAVLGVSHSQGRLFLPEEADDTSNSHPVAVISYGLSQRYFGGVQSIVNKTIVLNARPFTVVGVASKDFTGANVGWPVDVWVPMSMQQALVPGEDRLKARGERWLEVIARVKPGVSTGDAAARLTSVSNELATEFPGTNRGTAVTVVPIGQGPSDVQSWLLPVVELLMAVVFFILLIACSNVANLMLSRGAFREGEVAVRVAIGASRGIIMRLFLTESLLLSFMAGAFALFLSYESMFLLQRFNPPTSLPLNLDLRVDGRVMLFTLALTLLGGVFFGLIPAMRATRPDLLPALKSESFFRMFRKSKLQNALVVTQIALSLFLLVGAGLLLRSLRLIQKVDTGFNADNMVLASIDVGLSDYDSARGATVYRQILERAKALPGIRSASLAQIAPMEIQSTQQIGIFVEGHEAPNLRPLSIDYNVVGPEYFRTMAIPVESGREFTDQDIANGPGVAIVNEAFAKRFWPGQDAIGKKVSTQSAQGPYLQLVGVVKDSKYYNIAENPLPFLYLPFSQRYEPAMVLHVKTTQAPSSYFAVIEREVQSLDRSIPVYRVHSMKDQLAVSLIELRGGALFMEIFGMMALALASIGLYGLMAYSVEKRKAEIAVRMAVGAESKHVLELILKEGMLLTLVGIGIGVIAVIASGRAVSSLLYGVSPFDPFTISVASLFLIGVALLAIFIPARKAMRTDPVEVLRSS